jgi:hypothetical protein
MTPMILLRTAETTEDALEPYRTQCGAKVGVCSPPAAPRP